MRWSYDEFPSLRFDRPADAVLRITLDAPGTELGRPGRASRAGRRLARRSTATRRRAPSCCRAPARGSRRAAASSSSTQILGDYETRSRVHARGPGPRAQRHQLLEADRVGDPRPGRRRRARRRAAGRRLRGRALGPDHRRPHPPRRGGRGPRRDLLAVAVRHGQGEVLPADVRDADGRGGRADRPRVAVRRRRHGCRSGRSRSPRRWPAARPRRSARRSTRSTTGTGRRSRPSTRAWRTSSSASAAPMPHEGLASHRERRAPDFGPPAGGPLAVCPCPAPWSARPH